MSKLEWDMSFLGLSPTLVRLWPRTILLEIMFWVNRPYIKTWIIIIKSIDLPNRDVLIKVDEETLNKLHQVDININTAGVGKDFQIEEDEQSSTTQKKIAKTRFQQQVAKILNHIVHFLHWQSCVPSLIVQSFQAIASTLES